MTTLTHVVVTILLSTCLFWGTSAFQLQPLNNNDVCSCHSKDPIDNQPKSESSRRTFFTQSLTFSIFGGVSSAIVLTSPFSVQAKYDDTSTNGADPTVLLKRLQEADQRLDELEGLVNQSKWPQVEDIVSNLLKTLPQTLSQIAAASPADAKVEKASKKVYADVIAIRQAASKRNEEACQSATQQAIQDLESFVKVAFCQPKTMICFETKELEK